MKTVKGIIDFGLKISNCEIAWFPYYQAPFKVEKYINSWIKLSNILGKR